MEYKPKVITGKVTGTGWPIDGHVLWFSQWDYDNRESWHLYGWEDSEDEVVMQTVFKTETEAGLCLPLDKNLNGDVQAKHPDWEPVECPTCGRKCWKHPEAGRLAKEQGAKMLCTECAIKAGLLSPFRKEGPNRAQRRRAKRERRK